ncbi:HNH endonuclease signature motif containing protein [Nocardioides sp. cx-173]|uniref:HNH endonuclease signature motif containing protein n=1 Tax=Nocardioides sp. cx-173 TaxID=2898796 RepID=UPI001E4FCE8E|nr:HNH endonuclease signature motif containing protein [Nocardioides sp. cx-173]MCD4525479.1 HNH endonuclease [Nocardioides sp. cx-173]UGB42624.1 HNH endonuclease [Nocardioides sp. cx-173]
MSSPAAPTASHPVAAGVARLRTQVADLNQTPVWSMTPTETAQALADATRLRAQADELTLRLAAHADTTQVGTETGATSTAVYWANTTHQTQRTTAAAMKLAKALERHDSVAAALASGEILTDQAQVIVEAVDALPEDLPPEVRAEARAHLLGQAAHHDARALRVLGRRILDVLAPEVGEAHEAKQLEAEERRAEQRARLTMHDDGHGTTYGRFQIPTHVADRFRKQLGAIANPQAGGEGSTPHGMGLALIEYVQRYPVDRLPDSGGLDATVVVTMTLETLMGGLKAAQLDTGTRISPALARTLACQAGIIPAVLGTRSQVLDLGRKARFHTKAQRIALAVQHGGCYAQGCERPSAWCQAHHLTPWSEDGHTTVDDAVLLCRRHHTLAHHPDYAMTQLPGGKVAFTRRE